MQKKYSKITEKNETEHEEAFENSFSEKEQENEISSVINFQQKIKHLVFGLLLNHLFYQLVNSIRNNIKI